MPTANQIELFKRVAAKVKQKDGKGRKISISKEIRESGLYSETVIRNPKKVTQSKGWKELLEEFLPDSLLSQKHKELLTATRLDHMVFSTGVRLNSEKEALYKTLEAEAIKAGKEYKHVEILSDEDIKDLLASVNCVVRKIVHREMSRDVYFWAADNHARDAALDKGYKLKGKYTPEKHQVVTATLDIKSKKQIDKILGIT